jgi:[acyl-carrier-protein] S-malonyltransferase
MHLAPDGTMLDASTFAEADEALGMALSALVAEGPEEVLARTEVTQPAILAASVAAWRRLLRLRPDAEIVAAAGHSLGEYGALVAAGALKFPDALRVVRLRGRAMQEAVPLGIGGMAAVLGLEEERVRGLCEEQAQGAVVALAALNAPGQVTVAGHVAAVDRVVAAAEAAGGMGKRLAVSAPFHCSLLGPAAEALAEALGAVSLASPSFPVFHNVDAAPASAPEDIRARLVAQVVAPVRWMDCAREVTRLRPEVAWECGPGRSLAGMQRRIDRTLPVRPASDP